jgi:hypothetical protein
VPTSSNKGDHFHSVSSNLLLTSVSVSEARGAFLLAIKSNRD